MGCITPKDARFILVCIFLLLPYHSIYLLLHMFRINIPNIMDDGSRRQMIAGFVFGLVVYGSLIIGSLLWIMRL